MEDEVLADRASLIVEARVVEISESQQEGPPTTNYTLDIVDALKGNPPSTLTVRVLGGVSRDGYRVEIPDAPHFQTSETALFFLRDNPDGTYHVYQFFMGAFHRRWWDGDAYWVRALPAQANLSAAEKRPRNARRFSHWLRERASGSDRKADYAQSTDLTNSVSEYTLLESRNGLNVRWFEFDSGQAVNWWMETRGQGGVPGGGYAEFARAISAWNADPNTNVRYQYAGSFPILAGLDRPDGLNSIVFERAIPELDPFDCATRTGILGIGFPFQRVSTPTAYHGRSVHAILEADIVTTVGSSCAFEGSSRASKNAEELFAHELGHTLGLGHSSMSEGEPNRALRDALMYFTLHGDGRGARLAKDDQSGLQQLYGTVSLAPCRPGPTVLCLQKNRFTVEVAFLNQFDGQSGVARALRATDAAGFFYFYEPSNFELMIKVLPFGTGYKVFYGQLTNLHFEIRVIDTRSGLVKYYRNGQNDCGGIDQDGFPLAVTTNLSVKTLPASACQPSRYYLCFLRGRFDAWVDWRNQYDGSTGFGNTIKASDVTGLFYFTDSSNIELVVKMLDFGGRTKLFFGALSDLEYELHVTDHLTGVEKVYHNRAGNYCGGIDDEGF